MTTTSSPALGIAYVALRILIVLNWLMGVAIVVLLVVMPNERWIMTVFKLDPSPDAERLIMGLRAVAVLGLIAVPLHYVVLKRLLAIVGTVRAGDPFVATNAQRLRVIANFVHTNLKNFAAGPDASANRVQLAVQAQFF